MLLLLISFIAGLLTILAPCVLPVLPVIIGGSIGGTSKEKLRPYIIGASLAFSIIFFTLLLKVSTILVNIPPNVLNYISGTLLIALGLSAVFPEVWEKIVINLNWQARSQRLLGKSEHVTSYYAGPILIGLALGPVFASCSPTYAFILATVLPGSLRAGLIFLTSYTLGLVLALLVVSLVGRKAIRRFSWAVDTHSNFRRSLGVIFIVIGVAVFGGYEIKAETFVANHLPFDESRLERTLLAKQKSNEKIKLSLPKIGSSSVLNVPATPAPQLVGLTNWINSNPLTLGQLRGKVVLVDFWTYSCINCIRTVPFVEQWYQDYKDHGLVVIGVNTPEFAFEHNPNNVAAAVKKVGITYPVALDNIYGTWNAFGNDSWPADYLIDKTGNVRYLSLGEGDYAKTEHAIQELTGYTKSIRNSNYVVPISHSQTAETYFGTSRTMSYGGNPALSSDTTEYHGSTTLNQGNWSIDGSWQVQPDAITSLNNNASLNFKVAAKDVYVVASVPDGQQAPATISLPDSVHDQFGSDAPQGIVNISQSRLYHIVSLKQFGSTTVTITAPKGVSLYTFTFGS